VSKYTNAYFEKTPLKVIKAYAAKNMIKTIIPININLLPFLGEDVSVTGGGNGGSVGAALKTIGGTCGGIGGNCGSEGVVTGSGIEGSEIGGGVSVAVSDSGAGVGFSSSVDGVVGNFSSLEVTTGSEGLGILVAEGASMGVMGSGGVIDKGVVVSELFCGSMH
jgi:hypothetical protein